MNLSDNLLQDGLRQLGVRFSPEQETLLIEHLQLLQKWNKVHNLTAISSFEQMIKLHVLDSVSINQYLTGDRFVDVGTGAGFPGIPLAILNQDKTFVLLDSNGKKCQFLKQIQFELNLTNVFVVQSRIEEYTPDFLFDGVLTRAFSSIANIHEKTNHLIVDNGKLYLMLGKLLEDISQTFKEKLTINKLIVPFVDASRHLLIIDKT